VNFGFDSGFGSENQTKFRSSTPSYLHWSQELIVDLTALTAVWLLIGPPVPIIFFSFYSKISISVPYINRTQTRLQKSDLVSVQFLITGTDGSISYLTKKTGTRQTAYPLNTVTVVDNTWTITHMVKITWAPTLNRGFHSSNSRKNPCTVDMLCLASATCTYNLPEDAQNLKRPQVLVPCWLIRSTVLHISKCFHPW